MKIQNSVEYRKKYIMRKKPCYNYKNLFSFKLYFISGLGQYKKLLLIFFYFVLGFEKLACQTNSAEISDYEKIFSSIFNQQSCQGIRIFFILWLDQQSPQNIRKIIFQKNIRNVFRVGFHCFLVVGLESSFPKYNFFFGKI